MYVPRIGPVARDGTHTVWLSIRGIGTAILYGVPTREILRQWPTVDPVSGRFPAGNPECRQRLVLVDLAFAGDRNAWKRAILTAKNLGQRIRRMDAYPVHPIVAWALHFRTGCTVRDRKTQADTLPSVPRPRRKGGPKRRK